MTCTLRCEIDLGVKAPSQRSSEALLITALVVGAFIAHALFVYRGGMADPDSIVQAAGMAIRMGGDTGFENTLLYGGQVNPGMYVVVGWLCPLLFDTPNHLIGFLNWSAALVFALSVWPLYALFRHHLSRHAAAGAIVLFVTSPLVWEVGTYFHPLVFACLPLLLAMLSWGRIDTSRRGIASFVLTCVLVAAAVVIRTTVIFLFPAVLLYALVSRRPLRNFQLAAAVLLVSILAYFAVSETSTTTGSAGVGSWLTESYHLYRSTFWLPGLTKSTIWMVTGMGAVTCVLALVGLWRLWRLRQHGSVDSRTVAVAIAWILPSVLFWLPQPIPILRHYLLATIGVVWLVGYGFLSFLTPRRTVVWVAVAVVVNLALPEAVYRTYNAHAATAKTPHGAFLYSHQQTNGTIERYAALAKEVLSDADDHECFVLVNWVGYGYLMYAMATSPSGVENLSGQEGPENVFTHEFRCGDVMVRLMHVRRLRSNYGRKEVARRIEDAIDEGFRVYLPAESMEGAFVGAPFVGRVTVY